MGWGGEDFISSQAEDGGRGFFFFFFCNMLGVNVAKSSLHLHFLKTLEFRTDISVTGMPGAAGAIRGLPLHTHHPPVGVPRPETQSSLPKPFHSSCTPPRVVHASMTSGHQTSQGLSASALLRGRVLLPSSEPGGRLTSSRVAAWPCPSLDPWGSGPGAEPPCQSCYVFVLFHCSSFFPLS